MGERKHKRFGRGCIKEEKKNIKTVTFSGSDSSYNTTNKIVLRNYPCIQIDIVDLLYKLRVVFLFWQREILLPRK